MPQFSRRLRRIFRTAMLYPDARAFRRVTGESLARSLAYLFRRLLLRVPRVPEY